MQPFDMLGDDDQESIRKYIANWANDTQWRPDGYNLPYILRFWNHDKQDLFDMFGHELILTKEVSFKMGSSELRELMDEMTGDDDFCTDFAGKIAPIYSQNGGFDLWLRLSHLIRSDVLVSNSFDMGTIIVPGDYTVDHKPVKIQEGCKPMRTLHKLCHSFGLDEEAFERFRLKHSQILNTKELHGELCISIHPLDFMTMSDNDCGWDSCMSWMKATYGDGGEYRLGTVEMMNSPCVVIAYLKSHTDMNLLEDSDSCLMWNSKRWRQLVIVNKDLILGNRQYPYDDESLQGAVLAWLRELASTHYGTSYEEELTAFNNKEPSSNYYFSFSTDFMYNDIYDTRYMYLNKQFYDWHPTQYRLNFSGVASCMACGKVIEPSERPETSSVCCASCGGYVICEDCGMWLCEDSTYEWNYHYYCEECYNNVREWCSVCESDVSSGSVQERSISCEGIVLGDWTIAMCEDCYENYKDGKNENCVDIDELESYQLWEIYGDNMKARELYATESGSAARYALLQEVAN